MPKNYLDEDLDFLDLEAKKPATKIKSSVKRKAAAKKKVPKSADKTYKKKAATTKSHLNPLKDYSFEDELVDIFKGTQKDINASSIKMPTFSDDKPITGNDLQALADAITALNQKFDALNKSLEELPVISVDELKTPNSSYARPSSSVFSEEDLRYLEKALDHIEHTDLNNAFPTFYEANNANKGDLKMPTAANGWITQPDGVKRCYKNGELHSLNGPAEIRPNGTQLFYRNGLLHRDNGQPAMTGANGTTKFSVDGKYHRIGGLPAITWSKGMFRNEWWLNGEIQRAERKNGTMEWYAPGCTRRDEAILSRVDGPAVIHKNGVEEYWLNGSSFFSRSEWLHALNNVNSAEEDLSIEDSELIDEDPIEEFFITGKPAKKINKKTAKEKTMSNTAMEKPSLTDMMKSNFQDAAYRVAGTQATKAVKTAILTAMKNKGTDGGHIAAIASFLDTEFGTALISAGLGVGLNYVPHLSEDPRVQRVAEELRIGGIAVAGNAIIGEAMAHILPAITDALKNLPAVEETTTTNARVETKHDSLAEHLEEEHLEEETSKTMKA